MATFAALIGTSTADDLHNRILNMPVKEFNKINNSETVNLITNECTRLTDSIIQPLMIINAKIFLIFLIAAGMIYISPYLAIISFFTFGITYYFLYTIVRNRLFLNGLIITEKNKRRLNIIENSTNIFKEIKLYFPSTRQSFTFSDEGNELAKKKGESAAISQIPRYIIEYLALAVVIIAFIYQSYQNQAELGLIVANLSGFGAAAFKLLPATQQVYQSIAQIRGNTSALREILKYYTGKVDVTEPNISKSSFKKSIQVKNLTYAINDVKILDDVSFTIKKGESIGFVGKSGAGKSTLLSILLGFVDDYDGEMLIDGRNIKENKYDNYLKSLNSYVPQDYSIFNDSIRKNIDLKNELSDEDIYHILKMTNLYDYINDLQDGLDTLVSSNTLELSGGQKQRILISRAIASNRDIIYLDEGTSALDGINEKDIVRNIEKDSSKTIVMVAHRLKTLINCNKIYIMDQGKIVESGSYHELAKNSPLFKLLNSDDQKK